MGGILFRIGYHKNPSQLVQLQNVARQNKKVIMPSACIHVLVLSSLKIYLEAEIF